MTARLVARVENPIQTHEAWVEDLPGDPMLNMGKPTYPFITVRERGGEYRGERTIDLGTLVHLVLNVGEEELHAIARRGRDWTGADTEGPPPDGCPHSASSSRRYCNSCTSQQAEDEAAWQEAAQVRQSQHEPPAEVPKIERTAEERGVRKVAL